MERIVNDEGHYNTPQPLYFFNTYLKVYTVPKSTNEKYSNQGGIYKEVYIMTENKRLNPIEKAKVNPNSLRAGINAKCFDCCCDQYKEVTHCLVKDCPLLPLRPWQANETTETGGN